jgi:D-cysteine desulfhydrase
MRLWWDCRWLSDWNAPRWHLLSGTDSALHPPLSSPPLQLHAVGVCDSPEEFYGIIAELAVGLGLDGSIGTPRDWVQIHQGKGCGYALSTAEELSFLYQLSSSSGVILDPVYSGKGLFYFLEHVRATPESFPRGVRVLFIHTGGLYGLYANEAELLPLLPLGQVKPLL